MWLSYPNNPTGAVAGLDYFERVIEFAKRHDIIVAHDACYSEVAYDGYRPASFLQAPGAMDVGIEFHSLSKSYNMTGWRLGMAAGNSELIRGLKVVKSNLDSGVPQAIQHMGIEALKSDQRFTDKRNAIYQRRRDRVVECLRGLGLEMETPRASLYVWARVPRGYTSAEFTEMLLEEKGVVVSPGPGYGEHGEGYIRLSLTISDEELEKGLERIASLTIPSRA
jgi:LL-diaminopimelate aminotransferase